MQDSTPARSCSCPTASIWSIRPPGQARLGSNTAHYRFMMDFTQMTETNLHTDRQGGAVMRISTSPSVAITKSINNSTNARRLSKVAFANPARF